jgi:hypothetical protein
MNPPRKPDTKTPKTASKRFILAGPL